MRRLDGGETPRGLQSTDRAASLSPQKLRLARDTLRDIVGPDRANSLSDKEVAQFCEVVAQTLDIRRVGEFLSDGQKAEIKTLFQEVCGDRQPAVTPRREKPDSKPAKIAPRSIDVAPRQARIRPRPTDVAPGRDGTVDDVLKKMCEKGGPLHGITKEDYAAFSRRLVRQGADLFDEGAVAEEYKKFKEHRQTTEIRRATLKETKGLKPFTHRGEIAAPELKPAKLKKVGKAKPVAARAIVPTKIVPTELMLAMLDKEKGGDRTKNLLKKGDDPAKIVPLDSYATDRAVEDLSARSDTLVRDLRNHDALGPEEKRTSPDPADEYFNVLTTVINPHVGKIAGRNALTFSIAEDAEGGFDAICIWVEEQPSKRARLLDQADGRRETPLTICLHEIAGTTESKRKARQESRLERLLELGARVVHAPSPLLIPFDHNRPDLASKLLERTRAQCPSRLAELEKGRKKHTADCVQALLSTCEALAACSAKEAPAFAAPRKEAADQLERLVPQFASCSGAFDLARIIKAKWFHGLPRDQKKEVLKQFEKRVAWDLGRFLNASSFDSAALARCLSVLTLARTYRLQVDAAWEVLARKIEVPLLKREKKIARKPPRESITETMATTKILIDLYILAPQALKHLFYEAPVRHASSVMATMTDEARETMLQKLGSDNHRAGLIEAGRAIATRGLQATRDTISLPYEKEAFFGERLEWVLPLAWTTRDEILITTLGEAWRQLPKYVRGELAEEKQILQLLELLRVHLGSLGLTELLDDYPY